MSTLDNLAKFTVRWRDYAIGVFRIVLGLLFLSHGLATLFGLFGGTKGGGRAAEFASWPTWWAGLIQLVGGVLVAAGIGSRTAAFISSGSMAYAYFVVHQQNGLLPLQNGGEAAALFAWSLLLLTFTGPGALALESRLRATPVPAI